VDDLSRADFDAPARARYADLSNFQERTAWLTLYLLILAGDGIGPEVM
jgi:hypothetical protein